MAVLVTGASGFLGRHLVAHLADRGFTVVAASRKGSASALAARNLRIDVCDRAAVRALITDGIDTVYHLAFSRVRPASMAVTALDGTAVLLDEAAAARRPPRVLVVSSGAVYGFASQAEPLTEAVHPSPATYYAVIKHAQEELAASYARRGMVHVVIVRPFNLVGPGEDGTLVTGALALQIARGERGAVRFSVQAGNLDAYRDFIDVRDVARGSVAAVAVGAPGEVFNICSGRAVQVSAVVENLRAAARVAFDVVPRAGENRGPDLPYQVGSAARLQRCSGWRPQFSLEESLRDLLDDVRERVEAHAA
jgi:GDP-4-dehydro-6-deoxy-D-mannose reductase